MRKVSAFGIGIFLVQCTMVWAHYPIDAKLEGPESIYTRQLLQLLKTWPPKSDDEKFKHTASESPVQILCYEIPEKKYYIGIKQKMTVEAPFEQVEAVIDDIDRYDEIFPGYEEIKIISRDQNTSVSYWEQHIPLFFIPNVKYEMMYVTTKPTPNRKFYRYKLKSSKTIKYSDGIIVIERLTPQRTLYTEYDFWDADYGMLEDLAPSRIWKDSVEGIYLSDLGIKLKAEHPEWDSKKVLKEAEFILEKYPLEKAIKNKVSFKP